MHLVFKYTINDLLSLLSNKCPPGRSWHCQVCWVCTSVTEPGHSTMQQSGSARPWPPWRCQHRVARQQRQPYTCVSSRCSASKQHVISSGTLCSCKELPFTFMMTFVLHQARLASHHLRPSPQMTILCFMSRSHQIDCMLASTKVCLLKLISLCNKGLIKVCMHQMA